MQKGSGVTIFKQNWIILIHSILIVIFLIWVSLALRGGTDRWGYLGWTSIVYMSSGLFRGKESSNRIEISWLVQDLLNFGVLGSPQLWGGGRWVGWGVCRCLGVWGYPYTCAHACACTHTHVYMYRNCKWLPTWRHPCLSCLTCMWVCGCMCACMHVCAWFMGHPHTPTPIQSTHLSPFQGETPGIS